MNTLQNDSESSHDGGDRVIRIEPIEANDIMECESEWAVRVVASVSKEQKTLPSKITFLPGIDQP